MAIGTLPSGETWVQLGTTQTPTSGATVSFTNLPAVKKLRVIMNNVSSTAASAIVIRPNSDATAANYGGVYWQGATTPELNFAVDIRQKRTSQSTTQNFFDIVIDNASQAAPKPVTGTSQSGTGTGSAAALHYETYYPTAILTSLDVVVTGSTFAAGNTGTISLYGAY